MVVIIEKSRSFYWKQNFLWGKSKARTSREILQMPQSVMCGTRYVVVGVVGGSVIAQWRYKTL